MRTEDFTYLSNLLKERSGLVLTEEKTYLVESRLMPVARKHNIKSIDDLIFTMKSEADRALIEEVTDAMTTNESFFFRDIKPFEQFRDTVLPKLMENRASTKTIRIWSAACSSGQEPYSLAMILSEEKVKIYGWKIEIHATDISKEMLDKASSGLYSQFEIQRGLPVQLMMKYFAQSGDKWQIDRKLAEKITFKYFNLLDSPVLLGQFDIIFCRNVLIYFDQETKRKVLDGMARVIPPDGMLYLGGAETVIGVSEKFQPVPGQRGLYGLSSSADSTQQAAS